MAVGDDAVSVGYPVVPNTGEQGKVRYGAQEINRTRDFVAQNKVGAAMRHFNTVDELYNTRGSFPGQLATVQTTQFTYQWTGNVWRVWFAEGTWTPSIYGPAPFFAGTDNIRDGQWQIDGSKFFITGRIVFGGAVNFNTSGQHVSVSGVPGDISMKHAGTLGEGLVELYGWGGFIPVKLWPADKVGDSAGFMLRTYKTDGAIASALGSFSEIGAPQQSDIFHFSVAGFRNL